LKKRSRPTRETTLLVPSVHETKTQIPSLSRAVGRNLPQRPQRSSHARSSKRLPPAKQMGDPHGTRIPSPPIEFRERKKTKKRIETDPPDLFVCGHSHILKVARDPALGRMLYMNPGAAGKQGFQVHRTLIRFSIEKGSVFGVEVIQLA
ncbi:MAG: metallophosphoesterase family protein, partial [Balneolaceae bacterium]